jgi:hypothetical protein
LVKRDRIICAVPDLGEQRDRAHRYRTLHPNQRALPISELTDADTVYGYSFIVTNRDVSTPEQTATVEHWYRHRTAIENIFRDSKLGAALRHLPEVIFSSLFDHDVELLKCVIDGVGSGVH